MRAIQIDVYFYFYFIYSLCRVSGSAYKIGAKMVGVS